MTWLIEYWHDNQSKGSLEHWFDSLTKEQFTSLAREIKLLEHYGNELKLPHSRSLGKGLFELREHRYGYRVYYTFHPGQIIVLLDAGNKSTQEKDIIIARQRATALEIE